MRGPFRGEVASPEIKVGIVVFGLALSAVGVMSGGRLRSAGLVML